MTACMNYSLFQINILINCLKHGIFRNILNQFNYFFIIVERRIKLKQDIENRVMWRENYQEKLIETEKNFRASINQ